jgi:RsiW-degrading membrane proteinase PrsW (M82 family)
MSETNVLIFALLGGIVPALFWLWFWIREDKLRPEPKSAVLSSFAGGVLAVLIALFLELVIYYLLADANYHSINGLPDIIRTALQSFADRHDLLGAQTNFWGSVQNFINNFDLSNAYNIDAKKVLLVVIIAPVIEEFLKLLFTYNICLRRKINDEPVDAAIYMLTSALGFAAVETTLFLTGPLSKGNLLDSLIASNFRSIGPMLIHLVSSAILGLFIGLAFYKSKPKKFLYLITGLTSAIILHGLFNFFIMLNDNTHNISFFWTACLGTWVLVIIILAFFKKVKKVTPPQNT